MYFGIQCFSKTGNTYSVANKLKEKLSNAGHSVKVERLNPIGDVYPGIKSIEFESMPDIKEYELVIFGSPVWAFSLSPALKFYMKKLSSLEDKKIICFVTMGLPFTWMGGNNAVYQMIKICKSNSIIPLTTSVIKWNKNRDEEIDNFINNIMQVLK